MKELDRKNLPCFVVQLSVLSHFILYTLFKLKISPPILTFVQLHGKRSFFIHILYNNKFTKTQIHNLLKRLVTIISCESGINDKSI